MATEAPNNLLSTQTLRMIDLLCEGPISGFVIKSGQYGNDPLCSTYYDDVPVRNPDGSYNFNVSGQGFAFNYALGTVSQTGIPGFQKIENYIPLSANTRMANPPYGGGPYKDVVTSFSTRTFPDADSVKITVRVPALLSQDDQGNTNPYRITWAADVSVNDGPFEPVVLDLIAGKCTQPYLKTVTFTLPKPGGSPFYQWKVRVRRVSQNILQLRTQNEIYVDSISVISTTNFAYPNSALVTTEISAEQFGNIPTRSYEIAGTLVKVPNGYTPTQYPTTGGIIPASYPAVWDGTFQDNVWTDNPAWIFYDLMTNPVRGLGDYISPEYLDKWTLYDIAKYCDIPVDNGNGGYEPQFTCNVQIQQPEEAYTTLLNLASTFRGMLYYANGAIHAVQTKETPPVFSFTNANVVNGVFNYADSARNTRATVATVKWIDPDNLYRETIEYVEDIEGILKYGYNEKQMTAFACTSRGQAYRFGLWTLETERLQTETVTFQTDLEGVYLRPGDNFAIYDNFRNNRSQGGRILSFQAGRSVVTIDRPVEIQSGPVYTLTALIPSLALMGTGDVTDSSQIDLIRNSQIETYQVITSPTSSTSTLTIQGQFGTGLFVGSPFILSVSGSTGIFDQASFYSCLATAEIEPGKIEILGLKASSGVSFRVLTGTPVIDYNYPAYDWPPNAGDGSAIAAPSNLFITGITGLLSNNSIYTDLKLTWTDATTQNLGQYVISGKAFDESYEKYTTKNNGTIGWTYERAKTGLYSFRLAAQSIGGVYSSFVEKTYLVQKLNPFTNMNVLSGVEIYQDYDPLYKNNQNKYTGYIGTTPTFRWNITGTADGGQLPQMQFVSGYRFSIRDFADSTNYITPVEIVGAENNTYQLPTGTIYGFVGGAKRGFKVKVDVKDNDGNYFVGSQLNVNNPPMKAPFSSAFVGYSQGLSYNVTPSVQYDTSGIYLWVDTSSSYSPTYSNYDYQSSNLAGVANIAPATGSYYSWFALSDTFGPLDNQIYGPISGNASQMFGELFTDIAAEINNAFSYLTGEITNLQQIITGISGNIYTLVQGLSGSFTGQISGAVSQALSVQLQQVFASSGFATSQQVNAVAASVNTVSGQVSATGATLLTVIAATGGANVRYTVDIAAATTGQNAAVQIAARAFVTGSVNGQGGAALAAWGFKLNTNGKAASLQATSTDYAGVFNSDLILGNMNIKSDTFTAGSAGWQISYDGSAEFNNAVVRGSFTGGVPGAQVSINGAGIKIGNLSSSRLEIGTSSSPGTVRVLNPSSTQVATLGYVNTPGLYMGSLSLYNNAGTLNGVNLNGDGTCTILNDLYIGNTARNRWLYLDNDGAQLVIGNADTVNLYRGAANQLKTDDDLYVVGDVDANAFNTTSSRRFKENIRPLNNVMDLVHKLNGVQFDWNTKNVKDDIGLIAEDVYEVIPTIVGKDSNNQINGLEYGKLSALAIEAIKNLDKRVKELEENLDADTN
jgi:hypothetical protein